MPTVDLNCDLGEGCGNDAELMPMITSANIACGGHAGDAETMRATVELALQHGVAIGAHPGYPDQENFGRIEHDISDAKLFDEIVAQVTALRDICHKAGAEVTHVKPHGALYNLAARDADIARIVANAVAAVDHNPFYLDWPAAIRLPKQSASACGPLRRFSATDLISPTAALRRAAGPVP
jgi:5-oxoprolinase (ATP-hydrolysing) subunit A